jgi:DNA-binding Lrp family transcriptional regulator
MADSGASRRWIWSILHIVMASTAGHVVDDVDRRLIAALQCDGRATAERAAEVLGLSARLVARRWASLIGDGAVRVAVTPPRRSLQGAMLLRIRVLRGQIDAVARALAARDDVPLLDLSAGGDQLIGVLLPSPNQRGSQLVFRQLPATDAVTDVVTETVLHVYADAADWRLDTLTSDERRRLTPATPPTRAAEPPAMDQIDRAIASALARSARMPAAGIARATGYPESTVRRRLAALFDQNVLHTQVLADPRRLGLAVDADLLMRVPPDRLDQTGRRLAAHPAVHGAVATTGPSNLSVAVWLADLDHLYAFITEDLAALGVDHVETLLIGRPVKRATPPP